MTVKLSSSGIEILKKDLYDVPEVSIQRPKFIKIVISTVLLSLTIFVLYYIHHSALYPMLNGDAVDNSYLLGVKALFCICLFGGVLLALDIILLIVRRQIAEVNHRLCIFTLIISRNTLYMRVIISLLLSSVLLIYYESLYAPTIELIEDEDISKSIYIVQNFAYIVLALALFFTVQLCKSLMIMVIKYKLHFDIYKERIEKNNQQNEVLYMINKMAGREMYDDVKEWATWVYNLLKYNQPELTRTCCRHFFNEKETEIIFNMFDSDANGVISLKEFIGVFFGVIREKYFLNESLLQKNTLLNKLNWVFSCISVPIGLFLASSVLGGAILVKNQVSTITGAILSLSFVFSAIAGEVFKSLIFIFLVRPFEAGDVLKIDDKILIVKELGLMYTSFTIQSLTNYVQNTKLMDKYIVNYRLSDVEEKIYTYTFHLRPFKTQLEKLESLIGTHLSSDTKKYTGTFYIRNYRHGKGSDITVDIVICFKINFQYVKGLIKNEDEFVFELEDMFKSLNLEVL